MGLLKEGRDRRLPEIRILGGEDSPDPLYRGKEVFRPPRVGMMED